MEQWKELILYAENVVYDNLYIHEFGLQGARVWQADVAKPSVLRAHHAACCNCDLPPKEQQRCRDAKEAFMPSYGVHFAGKTPAYWFSRHAPQVISSVSLNLWRLLRHRLPEASKRYPPNSFIVLRYDEDN